MPAGAYFLSVRAHPSLARALARGGDGIGHLVPAALVLGSVVTAAALGVAEGLPPPENELHDVVAVLSSMLQTLQRDSEGLGPWLG